MLKKFHKVNIEISNICNLQCSFCPEVIRSKKLMDLEMFKNIIQQVAPLTDQVCFHLMGDPLVHPKLDEMVQICSDYQVPIFFVTNGVLLKEKTAELLLHPIFRQVNFSIHSFHDNFPNKDATGYLEKIFNFTDKAFLQRPDLYINYRLWNLNDVLGSTTSNFEMLDKISRYFGVSLSHEINVKKQKSVLIKNRLYLHFDTEFTWPSLDIPTLGTKGTCYGLKSHFGILVDGTVVPCCLDKEAAISLGNVQEQPIHQILSSQRAMDILNGFKNHKLVEELCQKCQYIERFQ
jgi:radical SAM protein with 4Fe4S-binding SPASM domain